MKPRDSVESRSSSNAVNARKPSPWSNASGNDSASQLRQPAQPVERVADVGVLEPGRGQLLRERVLLRPGLVLVEVLEQVDEDVEHRVRGPRVQPMRWYRPPGRAATMPASSSSSSIADTVSGVKPLRWHKVSTLHGS